MQALRRFITLALAIAGVAGTGAAVQPSGTLFETVDVRVVNLEAVVTDKSGQRVPNLRKEDFELLVDGQAVPIDFFSEVRGGDVIRAEAGDGLLPTVAAGEPIGTSYLVFVDEYFTVGADRNKVLRELQEQLGFLGPEDRLAIVAWDGTRIDMLSTWSQSSRDIETVLQRAIDRPSYGLQRLAERRSFETSHFRQASLHRFYGRPGTLSYLDPQERQYVDLLTSQLRSASTAVASALRGFAQPPGRKVLLLLSGPWPQMPAQYVVADLQRPLLGADYDRYGDRLYAPITETANLLGYTVYPVDVQGLAGDELRGAASSLAFVDYSPRNRDSYREWEVHNGLDHIALATGGVALLNGQRNHALDGAASDTRTFYWLGYSPQRQGDDAIHDVELRVRRKGLKVRARNSFVDLSRDTEVSLAVESALLFGDPSFFSGLQVALGTPRKAGWGKVEVPMTVSVPVESLTFLPAGDAWVSQLQLRVAVIDDSGHQAEIPVIPIAVYKESVPESGGTFEYETTLKLRSRDHEMVVALYDEASGEVLSAARSFSG